MVRKELEIDITNYPEQSKESAQDNNFIEYSSKIIDALRSKAKIHNAQTQKTNTNVSILKKVFSNASIDYQTDESTTRLVWCMARVNMFLRLVNGEVLDFRIKNKKQSVLRQYFNIAEYLIPLENDIKAAVEDAKKYDLDFDFKDIDDLYLDEYQEFGVDY